MTAMIIGNQGSEEEGRNVEIHVGDSVETLAQAFGARHVVTIQASGRELDAVKWGLANYPNPEPAPVAVLGHHLQAAWAETRGKDGDVLYRVRGPRGG
jgi:hypothetical protein